MTLTEHAKSRLISRHGISDHAIVCELFASGEVVKVNKDGTHIREVIFEGHFIDGVISEDRKTVITIIPTRKWPELDEVVRRHWEG